MLEAAKKAQIEKQSIKSKGGKREGAGRPAGVPNKISAAVKDNVIAVFEKLGGVQHMAEWATENPTQFYNIYSKLMPLQVNGAGDNGEHLLNISVEFVNGN